MSSTYKELLLCHLTTYLKFYLQSFSIISEVSIYSKLQLLSPNLEW